MVLFYKQMIPVLSGGLRDCVATFLGSVLLSGKKGLQLALRAFLMHLLLISLSNKGIIVHCIEKSSRD